MVGGRLRCSAFLVMFLVLTGLLQSLAMTGKFTNGTTMLVVASKVDVKQYPSRNSGLPRHTAQNAGEPPSHKLLTGLKLVKTTLSASLLIMLAGDVSLNPGPVTDPCALCTKGCRSNQKAMQCDDCDRWFHTKCMGMNQQEYVTICNPTANWSCMDCLFPKPCLPAEFYPNQGPPGNTRNEPAFPKLLRGLKIAYLNVNRFYNKLDAVRKLLSDVPLDVFSLGETWLTSNVTDDELNVDGYTAVRKDRTNDRKILGGGVIIYLRNGIQFTVRTDLMSDQIEGVWIQVNRLKCKPLIIGSFYRAPDEDLDRFLETLNLSLGTLNSKSVEIVILGDFNVNFGSPRGSRMRQKFQSCLSSNNLHQIIKEPTRVCESSQTMIDLICVNSKHKVVQCQVVQSPISDHSIVLCVWKGGVPKLPPRTYESRSFKNYCKNSFVSDLKNVPWNAIDVADSVDDAVFLWECLFCGIADCHAPVKKKRVKGYQTPWVTTKLLEIRRERDYHHRKARTSNSQYHWNKYRKVRNIANREERRLKSDHFCKLIEESKSDSSRMWQSIKQVLPSKSVKDIPTIRQKNKLFTKPRDIVEVFNKHFSTIGQKLSKVFNRYEKAVLPKPVCSAKFSLKRTSLDFVLTQLRSLKTNKATGLDKISARLLKDAAVVIAPVLVKLNNLSFEQGRFPDNWKSARVVALFKSGDPSDCNNYRPISILPTVSKIVERAVHSQLYTFLQNNNLLYAKQFGFRCGRSTSSALLQFTDELLGSMDHGKVTGVIYLDLKKAFDTVNHTILLQKLKWAGADSTSLKWFQSYLNHRVQRTVLGSCTSSARKVPVGVPQGSVLGPLLFLLYVNDLPHCLKNTQASLFADDTAIYYTASSPKELQEKLNEDLEHIKSWLDQNKLTLNVSKSKLMIIGGPQRLKHFGTLTLSIDEHALERVNNYKYLGVVMNETLSWSDHIEYVQSKVSQRLGVLRRIKHLLPQSTRKLVVNCLILPLLDYGDLVWGDRKNSTLMNELQILHNTAAKIILDLPIFSSSSDALRSLNWHRLTQRRLFHRCSFVFKYLHDDVEFHLEGHRGSDVHSHDTRAKSAIRPLLSKTGWGQLRTGFLFIKDWNNLPSSVRNATCVNHFRNNFFATLK